MSVTRNNKQSILHSKVLIKNYKEDQNNQQTVDISFNHIKQAKKEQTVKNLEIYIGKYYSTVKDNLKIMQEFESSETDEESSYAMKALRPQLGLKNGSQKFKDIVA